MNFEYKIGLTNVFWSNDDINTRFFETIEEQNSYFDNLVGGNISPLLNYNMGDNIKTTIVFRDSTDKPIEEVVKSNYCVVYKVLNDSIVDRRYFFASCTQDSGRQVIVELDLDDIQSNYFKYKNTIAPCMIRRANINRFIDNGDGTVKFDGSVDSKLFAREMTQSVSKRLTKRTEIKFNTVLQNKVVNTWLKDHVEGWMYLYVTKTNLKMYDLKNNQYKEYNDINPINYDISSPVTGEGNIEGALAVLCLPVMKSGKIKIKADDKYITLDSTQSLNFFRLNNKNYSYIYVKKYSIKPPFYLQGNSAVIEGDNLVFNGFITTDGIARLGDIGGAPACYGVGNNVVSGDYGILYIDHQNNQIDGTSIYTVNRPLSFKKTEIIGSKKDSKFNPKLLSGEFFNLNLTMGGQSFSYDYQKLNKKDLPVLYTEVLSPDITKAYARLLTEGVYIEDCKNNLTGLVYSNDTSIAVDNDQLSNMLANNKNFFLQKGIQQGTGLIKSIATGKASGIAESLFGILDTGLTLDNMRSAPHMVNNVNGSIILQALTTNAKLYIEEYDILPIEKETINDIMTEYGFLVNINDKITNYENVRKYYNYIEADVDSISAPLSNKEKDRLKDRLKGVRFWNTDTIQYDKENYERWLEK